jgi:hypothetical protein
MRGAGDANPLQISGAAAPPLGCAARTLRAPCLLSVYLPRVGDSHVQELHFFARSASKQARHACHGQAIVGTSRGRSCHHRLQLKTVLTENAAGISSAFLFPSSAAASRSYHQVGVRDKTSRHPPWTPGAISSTTSPPASTLTRRACRKKARQVNHLT